MGKDSYTERQKRASGGEQARKYRHTHTIWKKKARSTSNQGETLTLGWNALNVLCSPSKVYKIYTNKIKLFSPPLISFRKLQAHLISRKTVFVGTFSLVLAGFHLTGNQERVWEDSKALRVNSARVLMPNTILFGSELLKTEQYQELVGRRIQTESTRQVWLQDFRTQALEPH